MHTTADTRPGVQTFDTERAYHGYTVYNSRQSEMAHLLDMNGNVVHRYAYQQGHAWHYADLLPDGHLGAIIKEEEDGHDGAFLELDWESNLVRRFDVPAHHDFHRLENGNTVIVGRDYVEDVLPYADGEAKSDYLVELTPEGEPVWEWHAHEHATEIASHAGLDFPLSRRDWAHTNTVEVLPETPAGDDDRFRAGNIVISMRSLDTICVIDRETGAVVWAWGPGELEGQHMPTMLPAGTFLIYDNGMSGLHPDDARGHSRIVELDPIQNEIVWSYEADPVEGFNSPSRGSSQRLPNGNTFIAESDTGRLFEVTPGGDVVWDYYNPDLRDPGQRYPIYRAMRYPPELVEPYFE
jgi:hypothetical protein